MRYQWSGFFNGIIVNASFFIKLLLPVFHFTMRSVITLSLVALAVEQFLEVLGFIRKH